MLYDDLMRQLSYEDSKLAQGVELNADKLIHVKDTQYIG